jgi:putative endopeptidase
MKAKYLSALLISVTMLLVACGSEKTDEHSSETSGNGFDVSNMDTTVSPRADFYQFANGTWLANNPVPATESRWDSFNELIENNKKLIREILEESAADTKAEEGSNRKKIGDFYASGMDIAKIEEQGIQFISEDLAMIDNAGSKEELLNVIADLHTFFVVPMFEFFPEQDLKNNTEVVPYLYQGGLGMPSRDYYLKDDSRSQEVRDEYVRYISTLLMLAGSEEMSAAESADMILELETRLAEKSRSRVELRDPELNYNNMNLEELAKVAPAIDWSRYFSLVGVDDPQVIIINSPEFFAELSTLVNEIPLETWKVYTRFHYLSASATYLGSDFRQADFAFNENVLNGTEEMKPRWKLVQETIDSFMGEALGEVYCQKAFTAETKARMMELVSNLQAAFEQRINNLEWMTDETKAKAQVKLSTIINKIGYPDKWRDYSSLTIDRESYMMNVKRAARFEFDRNIAKIGKPVDKTEWGMSPQTVNAYYNPLINEIVFPAGILQPPFFDPNADDAVNYGAIGSVIGHEMTHGFDDQGRQFDAEGNLKNWWTSEDSARFEERAAMLVEQYSNYPVNDSLRVNGEFTLGENIADLGGVTIAYDAYLMSLKGKPDPEPIDGYAARQRFFLGYAQVWRNNIRPEAAAQRILTDPHSPGMYRCNGALSNLPVFYEAYDVQEGDEMYREEAARAAIW